MAKSERIGINKPVCAFTFSVANIADSQDGTAVPVDANGNAVVLPWDGYIVGMSVALNAAITAGIITIKATINGTEDANTAVLLNTTDTQFNSEEWGTLGQTAFTAGQYLGVVYDSDANVEANTVDLVVVVYVVFDDIAEL